MTARLYLRIAAVITVLFAAGHLMGGMESWSPVGETAVLRSMRVFTFDAMGSTRSYADFYVGFGLYIGVLLLLQAVLLWQLGALASVDAQRARPMVAAMLIASVAGTVVSWRFIFLLPTLFAAAIALCLGLALFASTGTKAAQLGGT